MFLKLLSQVTLSIKLRKKVLKNKKLLQCTLVVLVINISNAATKIV